MIAKLRFFFLLKYIPIFSILLIVNIVSAYALYESPTNEEKTDFDQLLAQFKGGRCTKKRCI
ncbi:exported protein of unknown function [Candidatus Nitrosotalea okcheonensis]|uniref:Uncharacterized protein n=1 Tax=Candidatus Nitrosotalea okcheonensis TaxID=1903276 RepID=A0A2H1FGS3_9ARCH|nr:exported protein of unknown function [Candidatus Nitrosotalea okcheonensis]